MFLWVILWEQELPYIWLYTIVTRYLSVLNCFPTGFAPFLVIVYISFMKHFAHSWSWRNFNWNMVYGKLTYIVLKIGQIGEHFRGPQAVQTTDVRFGCLGKSGHL